MDNIALICLISVATMLAYAIPGFITIKTKMIKPSALPAFSVILMYVCQPSLTIYSLNNIDYTPKLLGSMGIFFVAALLIQAFMLLVFYFVFRGKFSDIKYRVATVSTAFGNCAFMGVPILEAIMPDHPEAISLSVAFLLGLNLLGWTLGSALITNDKKYIKIKKALINPATIALAIALPLFILKIKLPTEIASMITLLGKMTTPLCMIILGMRLATVKAKSLFCTPLQYVVIGIKQIIMPLIAILMAYLISLTGILENYALRTLVVLSATPVASIVLVFAEMLNEGQETSANMVLLGTTLSIATMPLMILIMNQII